MLPRVQGICSQISNVPLSVCMQLEEGNVTQCATQKRQTGASGSMEMEIEGNKLNNYETRWNKQINEMGEDKICGIAKNV